MKGKAIGDSIHKEHGIAFLEAALSFLVLIPALLGGFATVSYMRDATFIRRLVESEIASQDIKSFTFKEQGGQVVLTVNHPGLEAAVNKIVERTTEKIGESGLATVFVEAAFAELEVDPDTGAPLGLAQEPYSYSRSAGSLFVPQSIEEETSLAAKMQLLAEQVHVDDDGGARSQFAVPSALYGDGSQQQQFLPATILLGLRIISSLEGTFSGRMYEQVGGIPFTYHEKVVVLRGELGYEN